MAAIAGFAAPVDAQTEQTNVSQTHTLPNTWIQPYGTIELTKYGADPTGTSDSTTAIRNAVAALQPNQCLTGRPGTYLISGTITISQNNACVRLPAVTFQWNGAGPSAQTVMVLLGTTTSGASSQQQDVSGLKVNGSFQANLVGFSFQGAQNGHYSDLTAVNLCSVNTPAACQAAPSGDIAFQFTAGGTGAGNNTAFDTFVGLHAISVDRGLVFNPSASGGAGPAATVNRFMGVMLDSVNSVGIDFVQNCDSNMLYGVYIAPNTGNTNVVGVRFGNSTTTDSDGDSIQIHGLTVDSGDTSDFGVFFNLSTTNLITGFQSVVPFYNTGSVPAGSTFRIVKLGLGGVISQGAYTDQFNAVTLTSLGATNLPLCGSASQAIANACTSVPPAFGHNFCNPSSGTPCSVINLTCTLTNATQCTMAVSVPAGSACTAQGNGNDATTGPEWFKNTLAGTTLTTTAFVSQQQSALVAVNVHCL